MSNALEKYLRVRGSIKLACEYLEIKYENDINWKNIILSLRNLIVEWSYQIGVLKFINIENQYGLQFDNCHLSIEKDKKFRIQNYIKVLCDNSKKSFLMKQIENDFKNFLSLLSNISKLEVANGHDMFEFIGLLIKSVIGRNHGEIAKGIEKDIRLSFECLFFSNTELVKKLKEWEIANNMILF